MTARKLTDVKRSDIERDLREGRLSMTQIARNHGCGTSSVSRIAAAAGLSTAGTAQMEKAQAARAAEMREVRTRLVADLIDDAVLLREQLWQPRDYYFATGGKVLKRTLSTPTPADVKALVTSVAILVDKSIRLDELERIDEHLSDFDFFLAVLSGQVSADGSPIDFPEAQVLDQPEASQP